MPDAAEETALRLQPGAPPWLWFWAVVFALTIPDLVGLWRSSLEGLALLRESTLRVQAVDPGYGRLTFLLYPSILLDTLPPTVLAFGLLTVLFPQARAAWIERRFRLASPPGHLPALAEIRTFVQAYAPRLQIRTNLLWPGQLAFVYPGGYREARLALFGGFVVLWRADRRTAEAVLLHEIAHYRHGDVWIVGVGSIFESMLRYWFLFALAFFVLPLLAIFAEQHWGLGQELGVLGLSFSQAGVAHLERMASIEAPGLLLIILSTLFRLASFLVLPLFAIWSAELNADRSVLDRRGAGDDMRRALEMSLAPVSWPQWMLSRLTHPPSRWRHWLAARPDRWALLGLLSIFPLAYLVRLLMLHGWAITSYLLMRNGSQRIWAETLANSQAYVVALRPIWLALAAVLALWPFLARGWEQVIAGQKAAVSAADYAAYGVTGLMMVMIAVLAYLLGM